ncbi:MAG: 6-phosphogluconate dehydrogenase [Burkholderiales bacterium PBB1]|nr:MAG: 6-phosphogluconate dehydrogenase [Burkholderiales bacterium PBB1]
MSHPHTLQITVLGLGQMGAPIARNLVARGFAVRVWNRDATKTATVPGALPCTTIAEAVAGADVAITLLADDAALRAVTLGAGGVLDALPAGAVHLGMSTVSLAIVRELVEAHAARGQQYIASPVFGRPDVAAAAKLFVVPGGPADTLERLAPVFAAIGQATFPMATPEQAALAKLAGNFMIAGTIEMLSEALAFGEKGGIDPEQLLGLLTGTVFGSPIVNRYGGMIARTEFEPAGFALHLGLKDVNLVLAASQQLGLPMPVASVVQQHLTSAVDQGRGDIDIAGVATVVREEAGLCPVRASSAQA